MSWDVISHLLQRGRLIGREVVGDAADARMHVGTAQLLGGDFFPGRRLNQRRAAEKNRAVALDDDRLVGHRRDIGAARRAGTEHGGNLGDAFARHTGHVVEDAPKMVAVGKDVGLQMEKGAARIDEIDAGQAVLFGDDLRPHVLLDRLGK